MAAHQLKRTLQELSDEVPISKKRSVTQARLAKTGARLAKAGQPPRHDTEKETKADLKDDLATLLFGPELPAESEGSSFSGSPPDSGRSSLRSIDIKHANRLVGLGTTSSELFFEHMTVGGEDVSFKLMSARKSNVLGQSSLSEITDILYGRLPGYSIELNQTNGELTWS